MRSTSLTCRLALDLARGRDGIVSRRELLANGASARSISDAITRSQLFPVFLGVYLVGRPHLTRTGLLRASVLAAGEGAVLGVRTAAAEWGFLDHRYPIEVLRSSGAKSRRADLEVEGEDWRPYLLIHRPRRVPESQIVFRNGLPLSSPARTLLDLVSFLPRQRFRKAFMEADRLNLLDDHALIECAASTRGRRGGAVFRAAVQRRIPDVQGAASLLEALLMDLVERGVMPMPDVNCRTGSYRPDFRWSAQGVLVETDGYEFHRGREAFENDILRSNRLRSEGWTVLRFTWRMVNESPDEVAGIIHRTLDEAETKSK